MESNSFTETRRWTEASSLESGAAETKQKIRFNFEEENHSSVAESASQSDFTNLVSSLVKTNKLLHDEIKQIHKDHRRTLKTLTHCCRFKRSEEKLSQHVPRGILKNHSKTRARRDSEKGSEGCRAKKDRVRTVKEGKGGGSSKTAADSTHSKAREIPREITSCSSSCDPESEEDNRSYDYSTVDNSPERGERTKHKYASARASHCSGYGSPGLDTIKSMWDNFSLKDYDFVTYVDGPMVKSKPSSHRRSRKCTVPEPFNMTVRESAKKKHKVGEASKPVADSPETDVRVQPVRVPPSTLMPIYELMRARDEQKKDERKKEVINKLKSTLKPFSFEARESQKHDRKEELMKMEEDINTSKPKLFKARPVPSKLFDPEVKERMLEEEDYRRIRQKMRSHELLANSKLPKRMHKSAQKASKTEREGEADDDDDHWFHPRISHDIPDYEEGYVRFHNQLAERKRSNTLTVPEPFHLKTEEVSHRRRNKAAARARREEEMKPKKTHSSSRLHLSHQPTLSAHTTQAQKLRQKKIQEMKSVLQLKEMEEEEKHKARKVERQMMQKIVKEAADNMYSSALELEEKRKEQAEERRRQEKRNSRKFQKELQEIDERVAARPLLLENSGHAIHKQERPQEFYSYALQKAGFSNKEIKKFLDSFQKEKSSTSDEHATD